MNIWTVISHIGIFVKLGRDVEGLIRDIQSGSAVMDDVKALLSDAATLIGSGVFNLSDDEIKKIQKGIADLIEAV